MTADGPRICVTCVGGLERLVAAEMARRVPGARIEATEFGRVHCRYPGPVTDLLSLRTIEHLHAHVATVAVRPERDWLDELEQAMAATDLGPALALLREVREVPAMPAFRVTATRTGEHQFTSPEVAAAAGAGVIECTGWPVSMTEHEVEVIVEVRGDGGSVGVRLSSAPLHRRSRIVHMRASLNATVAAAMALLADPQDGETVLDPMCGAGTLLTECHHYAPGAWLVAGDLFAEKLALARENFAAFSVPAWLMRADAATIPLRDAAVDCVLSNPPWGRVVANPRINRRLYPAFLAELARVLRPGGRAALLTSERRLMERSLRGLPELSLDGQTHLHIGGLEPSLYLVRRR